MFRIDDSTAATSLPTPEAAATEGFFTEGSPSAGTPATNVRASWLNMIQEELRAVVVAAGAVPSKVKYSQVLTAIQALFAGIAGSSSQKFSVAAGTIAANAVNLGQFASYLGAPGYQKLPSGLILQWGSVTTQPNNFATAYFPIAFPNAPLNASATIQNGTSVPPSGWGCCGALSVAGMQVGAVASPGNLVSGGGSTVFWMAIGY